MKKWIELLRRYFSSTRDANVKSYSIKGVTRLSVPDFEEEVLKEQYENLRNVVSLIESILRVAYPDLSPCEIERLAYTTNGKGRGEYFQALIDSRNQTAKWIKQYKIEKSKKRCAL